jgi:hypothetical protein
VVAPIQAEEKEVEGEDDDEGDAEEEEEEEEEEAEGDTRAAGLADVARFFFKLKAWSTLALVNRCTADTAFAAL